MTATVNHFLDNRFAKKDGSHAVKLRIFFDNRSFVLGTGISTTPDKYKAFKVDQCRTKELKELRDSIRKKVNLAEGICKEMGEQFEYDLFCLRFKGKAKAKARRTLYEFWNAVVSDLEAQGRAGTASSYRSSLSKFKAFKPHADFRDLNKRFFEDFQTDMLKGAERKDKALVSVGIYCRAARAVVNKAIDENLIKPMKIFGGSKGYKIPGSGKRLAIALDQDDLYKAVTFPCVGKKAFYRDMYYLLYLLNGSYPSDILHLQWTHIQGDYLAFPRRKTILTDEDRDSEPILITEDAREIIERYGKRQSPYIFGIINSSMTPEQQRRKQVNLVSGINQVMALISKELGVQKISCKTARHTAAATLMNRGAGLTMVQRALKHKRTATTESYVGGIRNQNSKDIAALLAIPKLRAV
jgi:integrase/recombinase XerD